jgi:hypothetical protein
MEDTAQQSAPELVGPEFFSQRFIAKSLVLNIEAYRRIL